MTTTPEPQPGSHPQDHPTQPLPPHGATAPGGPQQPAAGTATRLSPAQEWARYEAAQRAAQHPGGHPTGSGDVPPAGGTTPTPSPEPRKRSRAWAWIATAAVAGLLVGGGSVAAAGLLDRDGVGGSERSSSLADVGRSDDGAPSVEGSSAQDPDWQAVAAAVQASVVAIEVQTQAGGGQGSGVIIDDEGHVLTNNHVVSGAEGNVRVTLTDGRILEGEVVGTDPATDLAVVQLLDAPDDLEPATFGNSDDVRVGEPVMAVGNPLGLANTVTTGIVSALDRPVSTLEEGASQAAVTNAIQIDAAVNPGNSGGPLFDATGRVIGITSSIATLSQQSGSIGLGFAIPSDLAARVAAQLIEDGEAEHAFLGVTLSDGVATADGVTRRGAVVESVNEGSPAAEAGLKAGDVIVAIDGDAVGGAEALTAFVRSLTSGDEVTLTVVRGDTTTDVDVTLATRPDDLSGTQPRQDDEQGQDQGGQGGQGTVPGGLTPQELWEWLQQQQQGQG